MKKAENFVNFEIGGPDPRDPEHTTCLLSSDDFEEILREYYRMKKDPEEPSDIFIDEWRDINDCPEPVRALDMETGQWVYDSAYPEELQKDIATGVKTKEDINEKS